MNPLVRWRRWRHARKEKILHEHNERWGKIITYLISEYDDAMAEAGVNRARRAAIRAKAITAVKKFAGAAGS